MEHEFADRSQKGVSRGVLKTVILPELSVLSEMSQV